MNDQVRIDHPDGSYTYISKRALEDAQRFEAQIELDRDRQRIAKADAQAATLDDAPMSTRVEEFKARMFGAGQRPYEALHALIEHVGRQRRADQIEQYIGKSDAQVHGLVLNELETDDVGRQALDWAATTGSYRSADGAEIKLSDVVNSGAIRKSASYLPANPEESFVEVFRRLEAELGE